MKFKFDITDIDLTNVDAKTLNRDVDISQHLPQDIIGKGLEFQEIRKVENIELTNLWQNINSVLNNMFIHLAEERGISYYEKILDINSEGSLEDRRKKVFLEWNRQTIWTHRTLEKILDFLLGRDFYNVELFYDDYGIWIDVVVSRDFDLDALYGLLRWKILPANLDIQLRLNFKADLILQSQAGDYTYPQFLCGLHDTGTIPRIRWEGQATNIDINLDTAIDDAKNYKPLAGERHTATQLNNEKVTDTINMTSFGSDNVYSFEK